MSISSSCAVPTPPTAVSASVTGCNSAEVTWEASVFMTEPVLNYSVRYQWTDGGSPITEYTSSTSFTLQNLVPNSMYTVSVAGINSCGGTSEVTNTTFALQGTPCRVTVYCIILTPTTTMQQLVAELV